MFYASTNKGSEASFFSTNKGSFTSANKQSLWLCFFPSSERGLFGVVCFGGMYGKIEIENSCTPQPHMNGES